MVVYVWLAACGNGARTTHFLSSGVGPYASTSPLPTLPLSDLFTRQGPVSPLGFRPCWLWWWWQAGMHIHFPCSFTSQRGSQTPATAKSNPGTFLPLVHHIPFPGQVISSPLPAQKGKKKNQFTFMHLCELFNLISLISELKCRTLWIM